MKNRSASPHHVHPCLQGKNGFTLLEIIISVGLSAFLLSITYSTYFGINSSIDTATSEQEILETGRMMIELIKHDLSGALSSEKHSFKGMANRVDEGDTTTFIEFSTMSSITEHQPRLNRVGYALVERENSDRTMVRLASRNLKADLTKDGACFEVSRNITKFSAEFYDGTDWIKDWDSTKGGKAPQQVRLSIEIKDLKGNTRTIVAEEGLLGGK